jgi:hypothetical protein
MKARATDKKHSKKKILEPEIEYIIITKRFRTTYI